MRSMRTPLPALRALTLRAAVALCAVGALAAAPATALPSLDAPAPDAVREGLPRAPGSDPGAPAMRAAAAQDLEGTFAITAASCDAAAVSGSHFRMVQPDGNPDDGPFVSNSDSPCTDQTYTPLEPGTDGGLISGAHQPQPDSPFDAAGNGTASRIVRPAGFFNVDFALATNPTDPQTGVSTPAPVIRRDGTVLSGDLRAVGVAWNRQHFNQGAPKPDGETPGQTRLPAGSIDAATKAYTLEWTSTIDGGPFDGFTGVWHLEGTFEGSLGDEVAPAPTATPSPDAVTPGSPARGPTTPDTGPGLTALLGLAGLAIGGAGIRGARRRHA